MKNWNFNVNRILGIPLVLCMLGVGCVQTVKPRSPDSSEGTVPVVGFIKVEPKGPFFRAHQTEALVRFFDVTNTQTGNRIRVEVLPHGESFVTHLEPGSYELFRLQIGEGPFRSESQLEMTFQVYGERVTYLGLWRVRLDPPKTVRMVKIDVMAEVPEWDAFLNTHPDLRKQSIVVSLLQPVTIQARLFPVAPLQPRSKYFYRR